MRAIFSIFISVITIARTAASNRSFMGLRAAFNNRNR